MVDGELVRAVVRAEPDPPVVGLHRLDRRSGVHRHVFIAPARQFPGDVDEVLATGAAS